MFFEYCPLHPRFGVEVIGANLTEPLTDAAFDEIRAAFDAHALLAFRGAGVDDDQLLAFSGRFGTVQKSFSANQSGGSYFSRQSNIDTATNTLMPVDHKQMIYQKSNRLWHADSSYRPTGSLCSVLTAREVPPEGGNTEFVSLRAAWDDLPEADRRTVEDLVAIHSIDHSRSLTAEGVLSAAQKAEMPPARHRLVQTDPVTGRKSLFIGSHASHIEGWPVEEGRALLNDLLDRATQPEAICSYKWGVGDVVVWDNRCLLHRATPFDATRHRRLMQRTTVSDGLVALEG
jgi:alpha-ketoglutarate-dependent 2,4-dichlorophenoxyacetate dioxygenase